jgi:1-aminocyclopropane-1-carboxylate deaminase
LIELKIGDPFPIFIEKNKKKLTILNDWNASFCFGTKLRKAEGFYQHFQKKNYKAIQIVGDPNSNFLAAFTLYFYAKKIPVLSVHSSRSGYQSGNRILAERFSSQIQKLSSISDDFYFSPHPHFLKRDENGNRYENSDIFVVPKWGASKMGAEGLNFLWEHIYTSYKVQILYIDVGSGTTYLSALQYFKDKGICVIGICIGLPCLKMKIYLEKLEYLEYGMNSSYQLVEPMVGGRFGNRKREILQFIEEMEKTGCYLEPIYSGISLYELLEGNTFMQEEGVFYLHQGGLLPHIIREG